jgi:hypothetical protein
MSSDLAEREDICCELKRMLQEESEFHLDTPELIEFGMNHHEYGELWDLEVFAHPYMRPPKPFRIDLSFGSVPENESMEVRYPHAIPWIMTQLQTTKHIILDEWEKVIDDNLKKFNLFFDYIGNKELKQIYYHKLTRDVITFLYQDQKDKIEDDAVFNRMYMEFMRIITAKM